MGLIRLTCKQASRLQSQAMDRRLTLVESLALRMHMVACDACTNVAKQLAFIRRALRHYPGPDSDHHSDDHST
jgi:hypothetical protein